MELEHARSWLGIKVVSQSTIGPNSKLIESFEVPGFESLSISIYLERYRTGVPSAGAENADVCPTLTAIIEKRSRGTTSTEQLALEDLAPGVLVAANDILAQKISGRAGSSGFAGIDVLPVGDIPSAVGDPPHQRSRISVNEYLEAILS